MPNKVKRASRRHHEARVKDKFRKVAAYFAGPEEDWRRPTLMYKGKLAPGGAARQQYIEETAVRMAHHPAHQCQMCHLDDKSEKHEREREVKKKAPLITEDE